MRFVVAVRYPIIYAFVCQVDSGSWDTEIQDDVDPRDDKTRATPLGMALVLFAKEAPWGLGFIGCGPVEATVSYDLRNVWFCAFVPEL